MKKGRQGSIPIIRVLILWVFRSIQSDFWLYLKEFVKTNICQFRGLILVRIDKYSIKCQKTKRVKPLIFLQCPHFNKENNEQPPK